MELKDYLHFYLGCGVIHHSDSDEITLIGIEQQNTAIVYYHTGRIGRTVLSIDSIKPILRPLSDMTEEEAREAWRFVTDPHYYHVTNPKYAIEHGNLNISTGEWAKVVCYLLSNHFDLFGLIENELAIDKTMTSKHDVKSI